MSEILTPPSGPLIVPAVPADAAVDLSVVLPTYNEAQNILKTVRQLAAVLQDIPALSFEILVVDDDSPDRTWEAVQQLASTPECAYLRIMRREAERGLATAVVRGWQASRGRILGVMDADLQHPPQVIADLLAAIRGGAILAVGSRTVEGGGVSDWNPARRMLSRAAQLIGLLVLPEIIGRLGDAMSGCLLIQREALAGITLNPAGYKVLIEVLARGRVPRISEVGYVFRERRLGSSNVSMRVYLEYLQHLLRLRLALLRRNSFARFCLVGACGVVIDMLTLYLLSDPSTLHWGLTRSKIIAAELALVSNFLMNDAWTFAARVGRQAGWRAKFGRFLKFNAICGVGLLLNVAILNILFNLAGMNRYLANAAAILIVSSWNYTLNSKFGWRTTEATVERGEALVITHTAVTDPRRTCTWGWILAASLMFAYAVIFGCFGGSSLQDFPNHLARGVVMSDLMFHGGAHFGATFHYHFAAVAYVLGDIVLASAVDLLGPQGATVFWLALTVLSLPLAMMFYLRGTTLPAQSRVLLVILSLYLSTDGFLYMGFIAFRLAVALTLVGVTLMQAFRRHPSPGLFGVYCGVVVLAYLVHLSSLLFLAAAVGASGLVRLATRATKLQWEVALYIPILAVAAWHFGVAVHSGASSDLPVTTFHWGTWAGKLRGFRWDWLRYYDRPFDGRLDNFLVLALTLCMLIPAWGLRRCNLVQPAVLELVTMAVAFLTMYVVLPSAYGDASYLDVRPLAMVPIFLMLACLQPAVDPPAPDARTGACCVVFAALLTLVNLGYLTARMNRDSGWMAQYRAIVAAIPRGSRVLPLHPGSNGLRPYMHAAAFVIIDREAIMPYLFSGNRGNPQIYFRYAALPYSPPEAWYYAGGADHVNWDIIGCSYDYLLAIRPFDLRRLRIAVRLVRENERASLLAISRHNCATRSPSGIGPEAL